MFSRYIDNFDFKSRFRILKGGKISLVVSALLGSAIIASAAPTGGNVTSGTATISQNGNTTNINQTTSKASINWQNFNIASNETVNFNQPNVNSITLNRVVGNEKSVINGALNANGQVWILNSNGILFSKDAKVNTSGLVATTAELSDKDFQDGNYNFKNSKSNSVVNLGTIDVSNNGYVVLASNEVRNSGTIKAIKGKVYLSGNSEYTINLNGNSIVNLIVTKGVLDAMVENSGTIVANGGEIYLTTNAVNELLKGVVNNTGIIEANSLDDVTGKVEVFAHGGTANVGGEIKAEGGFVETSGKDFKIQPNAKIKAKEWLIDPVSIVVDSTLANTIQTALSTGDVAISTTAGTGLLDTSSNEFNGDTSSNGNIYVVSPITWNTPQQLTFYADKDIIINKDITATNSAGRLVLFYNQALNDGNYYLSGGKINLQDGDNFITKSGSSTTKIWTVISDQTSLQNMNNDKTKNYALGADVNMSGSFTSIGDDVSSFTGSFDGLGHKITGLTIANSNIDNQSSHYWTSYYLGLFGYVNSATSEIKNIGLENVNIQNNSMYADIGSLIGHLQAGRVENVYSTGSITSTAPDYFGGGSMGGLIGYAKGVISRAYSTAIVNSVYISNVGGLVGETSSGFSLSDSYYAPAVQTNSVLGYQRAGGLVGYMDGGDITRAYIFGGEIIGASNWSNGGRAGGAVGQLASGTASYIYSTAKARVGDASTYVRSISSLAEGPDVNYLANGLVGGGNVPQNSTYDKDTSGNTYGGAAWYGGIDNGKTTAEMTDGTTIASTLGNGFIYINGYYPVLKALMTPAAFVKVNSASGTASFTGGNGYTVIPVQDGASVTGTMDYIYSSWGNLVPASDFRWYVGDSSLSISGSGLTLVSNTQPTQADLQKSGIVYISGKLSIKDTLAYTLVGTISDTLIVGNTVTLPTTVTFKDSSNRTITPTGSTNIKVFNSSNEDVTSLATTGNLPAGDYTVKAGLEDNNYAIGTNNNTTISFSVAQKRINYALSTGATASLASGSSFTLPTVTYTNTINGINVTGSPTVKVYNSSNTDVTAQALAGTLAAGTYTVKATLTDPNYRLNSSGNTTTTLTVSKANINYSFSNLTKAYGQSFDLPTPTYLGGTPVGTSTVKVYDSNSNDVTAQATAGRLTPGNYTVKTILVDNNYELASSGNTFGTLTIDAKPITGILASLNGIYGTALTLPTATLSDTNANSFTNVKVYNVQNQDVTSQALNGTLVAGTYTVKAENSNSNYSLANTTATLTVGAKPITGTLASLTGIYGTALTLPTATLSDSNATTNVKVYNLQNQDVTSQALNGTLVTGTYTVKAENSNLNYLLSNTVGTLTINAKPTKSEISLPKINQTFGQVINLDGILSNELISQGAKIVVLDASNKDVTELALQGKIQPGKYSVKAINENSNYTLSSNAVELTINPALDPITLVKTQVSVPVISVVPTINVPKVVVETPKPMQLNQDMALKLGISESSNVSLVSQTIVGQPNQVITLSDLKPQSSSSSTDSINVSEVRVPLSQNSIVDLVNGGITLPSGVSQQFFIIDEQNNTNKGTN